MAGTVDSGNETLFSDDSSCELDQVAASTPVGVQESIQETPRNVPPKIQPYSGVLEKGKIVIRPIAFKPVSMTASARFGMSGERYGSTPILARPGSHLVHYGSSNDLRQYSLDRKLLSSASSSPPHLSSLSSLPHKLIPYDSMESVRKSPLQEAKYLQREHDLMDLTPSPSDSGVSELEAALRDRDSELAYLRQTMEHNEQVIFRVYQEKERVWERELRRLKTIHENRLRASAQKVFNLEQKLMTQTYQLQQDKKRLCVEAQRTGCQIEQLKEEVSALRERLEETEWGLCQKTGEISLLKTQLKDSQNEQTSKGHDLLQLRGDYRNVKENLERREREIIQLRHEAEDRETEIDRLHSEMKEMNEKIQEANEAANNRKEKDKQETERLKAEVKELREELSEVAMSEYEGIECGRSLRNFKEDKIKIEISEEDIEIQRLNGELVDLSLHSCPDMERLQKELEVKRKDFELERLTWAQEKEKVLRYQRQLQLSYVQMFRRTKNLENEVESLNIELELCNKNGAKKQISNIELAHTVEL